MKQLPLLVVSVVFAIFAALPEAALASAAPPSQITRTAPARLTPPTSVKPVPSRQQADSEPSRSLPYTGFNPLPEALAGLLLLSVGVGLRFRSARGAEAARGARRGRA